MRADNLERDNRTGPVMVSLLLLLLLLLLLFFFFFFFFFLKKLTVLLYYFVFLSRTLQELKGEGNSVDQKELISLILTTELKAV